MLTAFLKMKGMPPPVIHLLKESGRATHFPHDGRVFSIG